MVQRMSSLSKEELGIIPKFEVSCMVDPESLKHGFNFPTQYFPSETEPPHSNKVLNGATFTFNYNGGKRTVVILFRSSGIIGRGMIVIRVCCSCYDHGCEWLNEKGVCDWQDHSLVMKLSFATAGRAVEDEIIAELTEKAKNGQEWVLNHLPRVFYSFIVPFDEHSVQGRLKKRLGQGYEEHEIRVSVREEIFPLWQLESEKDLATILSDTIQFGRVLHRDISTGNLMFRRINGELFGILSDYDLATCLDDIDNTPSSNHRTGTRPFMAHEQHDQDWNGLPLWHHDAESFLYVILILACHYSKLWLKVEKPLYKSWYHTSDGNLDAYKHTLVTQGKFKLPVQIPGFRQWLVFLSSMLSSGVRTLDSYIGAQERNEFLRQIDGIMDEQMDGEKERFDAQTLGEHFTIGKLQNAMKSFNGCPLPIRSP